MMRQQHSPLMTLVAPLLLSCSPAANAAADGEPPDDVVEVAPAPAEPRPVATTAAVEDLQSAFKTAIAAAEPAVVSVYSTKSVTMRHPLAPLLGRNLGQPHKQQGLGSGFVVDREGYILTNNHVVEGADEVKVKLSDDRELTAEIVGTDPPTDLALLKVESDDLSPIELGDSDAIDVGDWVLAIGNPFGLPRTVSAGIVSAKGRANVGIVDYENFIQSDAAVNPGNSGGPLVDLRGRVVGINTAIASRGGGNDGIAFAIPVNMAKSVVEQLRGDGKVVRGHLGVLISELSPELARSFEYQGDGGLLVQHVSEDSAAALAGVKDGDIILELDGKAVDSVAAFRNQVARQRPGERVTLRVWRDGSAQSLEVKLGERPGDERATPTSATRPKLGIALQDLTPQLGQRLGLDESDGVVVTQVEPGSPAQRAGIRPGDQLTQIGSTDVDSARQALELLRKADLDDGVRLRLVRGKMGRYVFVRAAE